MSSRDDRPRRQVAVALRYDPAAEAAPRVAAKGKGELARRIEEAARARGIPVREDPDLAQVLVQLDLGMMIPEKLYRAVAEVLGWVYRMNGRVPPGDSTLPK